MRDYASALTLERDLADYFQLDNYDRPDSALDDRTPAEAHWPPLPNQA